MHKDQMQSVPIEELLLRDTLPVDVFILLGADKFLHVAKIGQPSAIVKKYMVKGLDRVYVRVPDYFHLVHLSINEANAAVDKSSGFSRLITLQHAMATVYREISDRGIDETTFSHIKMVNHATMTLVRKTPRLADIIADLDKVQPGVVKQSLMVSMLSAMLGIAMEWTKPGTIEKLALGGFLHDVGKSKVPKEILEKHPSQLSQDDKRIYQSHPEIGHQLLLQVKSVPEDILLMVLEHHERSDGLGFPRRIKDMQISPLAKLVAVASAYCEEYLLVSAPDPATKSKAAFDRIMAQPQAFNKDVLKALQKVHSGESLKAAG